LPPHRAGRGRAWPPHRLRHQKSRVGENDERIERDGYTTDLVTERAARFIDEHRDGPFFVAYTAPHWPYQAPGKPSVAPGNARHVMPHEPGTGERSDYVAMVEHLDRQIGELLTAIEGAGIAEDTIVIADRPPPATGSAFQ
jgi:arylsulfatase A-like enzyme